MVIGAAIGLVIGVLYADRGDRLLNR